MKKPEDVKKPEDQKRSETVTPAPAPATPAAAPAPPKAEKPAEGKPDKKRDGGD